MRSSPQASGEETQTRQWPGSSSPPEAIGHDDGGINGDGSSCEPLAWYGDLAYGSAELQEVISQAGHQAVISPGRVQRPVKGGFTIDDFTVARTRTP